MSAESDGKGRSRGATLASEKVAAFSDIAALPGDKAKRAAIQTIADVRLGRRSGIELEYRANTGD